MTIFPLANLQMSNMGGCHAPKQNKTEVLFRPPWFRKSDTRQSTASDCALVEWGSSAPGTLKRMRMQWDVWGDSLNELFSLEIGLPLTRWFGDLNPCFLLRADRKLPYSPTPNPNHQLEGSYNNISGLVPPPHNFSTSPPFVCVFPRAPPFFPCFSSVYPPCLLFSSPFCLRFSPSLPRFLGSDFQELTRICVLVAQQRADLLFAPRLARFRASARSSGPRGWSTFWEGVWPRGKTPPLFRVKSPGRSMDRYGLKPPVFPGEHPESLLKQQWSKDPQQGQAPKVVTHSHIDQPPDGWNASF